MLTALLKRLHCKYPDAITTLVCQKAVVPLYQTQPYRINAIAFNPKKLLLFLLIRHCRQCQVGILFLVIIVGHGWH